jgi:hypothetical protein
MGYTGYSNNNDAWNVCRYRDIFGKPNEGVHSVRFLGMAAVDLAGTLAIAWALSTSRKSFLVVSAALLVLSVLVHRLFCVDTVLTTRVFGGRSP